MRKLFASALSRSCLIPLLICLSLSCALRFTGLTRGLVTTLPDSSPSQTSVRFYGFHPDEQTVVRAALALTSPFAPPFTNYGLLPLYLLRAALEIIGAADGAALSSERRTYEVFATARLLSVLASCVALFLAHLLARHYSDPQTATLAALLVGVAPIAIQQAHFYTVDTLFLTFNTASLLAMSKALEDPSHRKVCGCALLIGLASSVRHLGLLLLPVWILGHLLHTGWKRAPLDWRLILRAPLLAVLVTSCAVLLLQPYLLTSPDLMLRLREGTDFYYAAQVAQGALLRTWSLAYYHTTPYLYHWTALWPDGVGWPVTILFAVGLVCAIARADRRTLPLLLWAGLYFAVVGGLYTKHMRYLLPLLPACALFAARLVAPLFQRPWTKGMRRGASAATAGAALLHGVFYGVAFAGLYAREDARITCARWIERHVPQGAVLCVEDGAFALGGVVDGRAYRLSLLELNELFDAQGYFTCATEADRLSAQLKPCDYIAITDVNRLKPFTHVPDLFPATASFYRHLVRGELGFARAGHFKNYPTLLGTHFRDDDAEVSFLSFDHPAVFVLQRRAGLEEDLEKWRRSLTEDPHCVDGELAGLAADLRAGQFQRVVERAPEMAKQYPSTLLVHLLAAHASERSGQYDPAFLSAYRSGYYRRRFTYAVPGAAAMSFARADLGELSLLALADGLKLKQVQSPDYTPARTRAMAHSYLAVGDTLLARGHADPAARAWAMAMSADPSAAAAVGQRRADAARENRD